jgi:hypothetical protein
MMKKSLFFLALFLGLNTFSQQSDSYSFLETKELKNNIRLNYTTVHMPNELDIYGDSFKIKPTMGLVGLNYNLPINNWLYTGAGMHFAVTGDQGGLFTLGVTLGVNKKLYKNLYFDANMHFAGGGGYRMLVNGGGLLYSNIGLQYKKDGYSFGVQYGNVNFFTGFINNDNISFFVEIPNALRAASYKQAQKEFTVDDTSRDEFWKKPAVKNVQQVTFDFFYPIGDSRTDSYQGNKLIDNTLYIIGFEYQRYITNNTFAYVHTDTMYKGLVAGFMDLFVGVGKNFVETKYVNLFGKFGIGGAGGRIYQEGGLTMYPNAGLDIKLTDNFGLSVHGGYHRAIGGTFEAYTLGTSIKYYGLSGGNKHPFTGKKIKTLKTQGIRVNAENQTYFNVAKFGIPASDLQLIAIRINYDLNRRFYVSGEASFAYEGKSGGYAHGLFGLGVKSNTFSNGKFSVFGEVNAGVAGGGRVDTGEGVLLRPTAGVNFHLTEDFSAHISGGQMISPFGNVNSMNFNIGLSYGVSILNSKK